MLNPAVQSKRGFSLIELLALVAVVGVLVALAVPSIRGGMTSYRLSASANLIAEEMEAARLLAISRGAPYEVQITSGGVQVIDTEDRSNPPRIFKTFADGVHISSLPTATIVFFPRGHAQGASLVLSNDAGSVTVSVQASGKVKVRDGCSSQSSAEESEAY